MPAIEQRVESLERTLRSWRRAAKLAGVACAVAAAVLLAAALCSRVPPAHGGPDAPREPEFGRRLTGLEGDQHHPRTIEADCIAVLDRQGRRRIVLDGGKDEPAVALLDAKGKKRLILKADDFGAKVELLDAEEKVRAGVRLSGEAASVALGATAAGGVEAPVVLRQTPNRANGLFLAGTEKGEPAASLATGLDGDGRLEVRGKAGSTSVTPGGFVTFGKAGAGATLETHQGNVCILSLYDREQRASAAIQLRADAGQHTLEVKGPDRRSGIEILARPKYSYVLLREAAADGADLELRTNNDGSVSPEILFHKHNSVPGGTAESTPFLLGMRSQDRRPYMVMRDDAGQTITVAPGLPKTETK